jgi:predicted lipoprotein with Yx(FWY)xxD motif
MRRIRLGLLVGLAALGVTGGIAAAANVQGSAAGGKTVKIGTRTIPGLGKILVSSSGRTLYMFAPDKDRKVTCVSSACVSAWPPLFLPAGAKPKATGGAKQSLLSSVKDPKGGRVITYKGWPLYLFAGDRKPGQAIGQDLNVTGGFWYVISYTGALIKHKPTKTPTTTTTTTTPGTTTTGTTTTPSQCQDLDNDGDQQAGGPDDGDGCL